MSSTPQNRTHRRPILFDSNQKGALSTPRVMLHLGFLLCFLAPHLRAQCPMPTTMADEVYTFMDGNGTHTVVKRPLTGIVVCTATGNAEDCFPREHPTPPNSPDDMTLYATRQPTTAAPFCEWVCTCGTGNVDYRIDSSDGLPIELMEFEIKGP